MTKEELKEHCEKQVKACEMWAENRGQEPSGKVYEEHKLVLDLINALEQQPCDDCENNYGECCRLLFEKSFNKDYVSRQKCKEGMIKYGFHAPDMTVTEFIEDELPPVTPKIPTSDDYVSLGVYKQVMWERDIAIEQLKELGYGFGEKIRTSDDCVSRQVVLDLMQLKMGGRELYKKVYDLPSVTPKIPTSEDCVSRADLLAQINESWETIETKIDFVNIVKASPSVIPTQGTCKDCKHRDPEDKKCDCGHSIVWQTPRPDNWYCKDFKK